MKEQDETPEYEAKSHSESFLKKAVGKKAATKDKKPEMKSGAKKTARKRE